ncbi:hypothetical protein Tco_0907387 [Tanacetum coccineum]|uniref:Uncharacterized protein n=1 Tax=Tanacetum coccineum TaxID=301880 RepID=A0ABQ5CKL2_9ASTR
MYVFEMSTETLNDALRNQFKNAEEYAHHLEQTTNFMENQIVWESRQEDRKRLVPRPLIFFRPQRNPNKPPSKEEKQVMYLIEIVKFCDARLEKVLKEVKLKIFQSEPWRKSPLLGELDHGILRAFEREINKELMNVEIIHILAGKLTEFAAMAVCPLFLFFAGLSRHCYDAAEVGDRLQGLGRLESTVEPTPRLCLPVSGYTCSGYLVSTVSLWNYKGDDWFKPVYRESIKVKIIRILVGHLTEFAAMVACPPF